MHRVRGSNRGFTLIEMLAVIVIVMVLMGVVMTSIISSRQSSRDGKRIGDISQLRLAIEHYYDACGQYPQTIASLSESSGCTGSTNLGNFLGTIPTDPNGGSYYYYPIGQSGICYSYHIGALLENGSHRELSSNHDVDYDPVTVPTRCVAGGSFQPGTGNWFDGVPGK